MDTHENYLKKLSQVAATWNGLRSKLLMLAERWTVLLFTEILPFTQISTWCMLLPQEVSFFITTETLTGEQRKCFKKINAERQKNIKAPKIALLERLVMWYLLAST